MVVSIDFSSINYDSFYKGMDFNIMIGIGMLMVEEDLVFWILNYNDGFFGVVDDIIINDFLVFIVMGINWEI